MWLRSQIRLNLRLHVFLLLPILFFIGCAAIGLNRQVAKFQRPPEYIRFFELLDRTVTETGVRDASVFKVSGFPYLRTNRFLTGLKDDLNNYARKEQWVRLLQQLDLEARQKEILNLPAAALKDLARQLGEPAGRQMLQERAAFYSAKMFTHDQRLPNFYEVLLGAIIDPSEYSTAMRVVGIYPLASIPVTAVTRNVQEKFRKWHHAPADSLEMLPHKDQTFESIFNSAGIGKGSGRVEPLIFFPMGIVDIGSMRQRGHHATKLVGREHFDDPDLFDRNFEIE